MSNLLRTEQKLQTREKILAQTIHLFSKQGIQRTKTTDIAHASAVSHGTIFVHFKTRDVLVKESIEKIGKTITDRLHALTQGKNSLQEILKAHLLSIQENENVYRCLLLEGPSLSTECRTVWVGIQSAISFYISTALFQEIEKGTLRSIVPSFLFNTWIGLIHHYLANRDLFVNNGSVLSRHGDALIHYFLNLLAVNTKGES